MHTVLNHVPQNLNPGQDTRARNTNPASVPPPTVPHRPAHRRLAQLPGLLAAAQRNQARGFADLALFEIGPVFSGGEPEEQGLQIAGLLIGRSAPKDVHASDRDVDLFDVKADALEILGAIGAPAKTQIRRGAAPWGQRTMDDGRWTMDGASVAHEPKPLRSSYEPLHAAPGRPAVR